MKCPLRSIETKYPDEQIGRDQLDCLEAECAWWIDNITKCAVKDIALEIGWTQRRLADLAEKISAELHYGGGRV